MDFSKINRLVNDSCDKPYWHGAQLKIIHRNYGGQMAVTIAFDLDYHDEVDEMIGSDFGWEQLLQTPWFPYYQANTVQEALVKLVDFINNEVPDEPDQINQWAAACCALQNEIVKQPGNGCYYLQNDHNYTFPPKKKISL